MAQRFPRVGKIATTLPRCAGGRPPAAMRAAVSAQLIQNTSNAVRIIAPASMDMAANETLTGGDSSWFLAVWYGIVRLHGKRTTLCIHWLYTINYKSAMPKEKIVNFRIDGQLKKHAKKLAEEDGRSLSNWLTHLIEREVAKAEKKK